MARCNETLERYFSWMQVSNSQPFLRAKTGKYLSSFSTQTYHHGHLGPHVNGLASRADMERTAPVLGEKKVVAALAAAEKTPMCIPREEFAFTET